MRNEAQPAGNPKKGVRRRWPTLAAISLGMIGAILITVASCSSRSGPPEPSASAAGSIEPTYSSSASSSAASSSAAAALVASPTPTAATTNSKTTASSSKTAATSASKAPAAATSAPKAPVTATAKPVTGVATQGPILDRSLPVSMTIPSLGVSSALLSLGLLPDGTMAVPSLTDPNSKAGWYNHSPTPGALGPSIIVGHIDSKQFGPGVFYKLGDMKPGDMINVTRQDGQVAVFKVDGVRSYPKADFPTLTVYGNLDHAGLRLITCGGVFNNDSGHYDNNIVVFASMVSYHHA